MYIYNYFIILLGVCVSYDTRFDTIHDTKKSKIDSRFDHYDDNKAKEKDALKLSSKFKKGRLELSLVCFET